MQRCVCVVIGPPQLNLTEHVCAHSPPQPPENARESARDYAIFIYHKRYKKLLPDIFSDLVSISMSHEGEIKLDDSFMKPKSVSRPFYSGFSTIMNS